MNKLVNNKERELVIIMLVVFFIAAVVVVFNSVSSYGGGDHYAHFKLAYWGWKYPKLLFDHWGKPVFTLMMSPFAQLGMNVARLFNVSVGLFTAFLSWKLAVQLKFKNAWLTVLFVLFAPVYFNLMFSVMTEVLHSLFLVLAVLFFFKKKYIWSAVAVSFLPLVRNESIVLFPIFILALGLKKQWKSLPFLFTGFLLISIAGSRFHESFWWLVTEMPYNGNSQGIYGHGTLLHFVNHTNGILGYPMAGLFVIGLAASIWRWYKYDCLKLTGTFFFILLVPGVFLTFFAAHSFVWWKGLGNSLGLVRVIGSVAPLAAITALAGLNDLSRILKNYRKVFIGFATLVLIWIIVLPVVTSRKDFSESREQKVVAKAIDFIKEAHLENHKVYFFDIYVPFKMNTNPYDTEKTSEGVMNSLSVSASMPDSSLIIWDAHFGPNEGGVPLNRLLNDKGLKVIKVFYPEHPFKALGGYDYKVYLFQKVSSGDKGVKLKMDFEKSNGAKNAENAFTGTRSFHLSKQNRYANILVSNTAIVCKDSSEFVISGEVYSVDTISGNGLTLVVVRDGSDPSFYKAFELSKIIKMKQWSRFEYKLALSPSKREKEILKVFLWNRGKKEFWIDDIELKIEPVSDSM